MKFDVNLYQNNNILDVKFHNFSASLFLMCRRDSTAKSEMVINLGSQTILATYFGLKIRVKIVYS